MLIEKYEKKIDPIQNDKQELKKELRSVRRFYNWIHLMNDSFNFSFIIVYIALFFSLLSDEAKTYLFLSSLNEIYWILGAILVLIIVIKSFITYWETYACLLYTSPSPRD